LILRKVVIGGQIQLSDEFILHQTVTSEGFVESQGRVKLTQETSQLMEADEGGSVGVKVRPNFTKMLCHAVIKKPCFLNLSLIIALQNDSNEQLKEDEANDEVKAEEVRNGETCISTPDCLVASLYVIEIVGIYLALSENRLTDRERALNRIP
jgi:hypothetical protein